MSHNKYAGQLWRKVVLLLRLPMEWSVGRLLNLLPSSRGPPPPPMIVGDFDSATEDSDFTELLEDDDIEILGRIHSVESMTAVDGPGLRYLVFLQGCPRRCIFCANPDSWDPRAGEQISSKQLAKQIERCRVYLQPNGGGVTLSGGEPLLQPSFCRAIFDEMHALGLTTCLDTTGYGTKAMWDIVLPSTDLVLLCAKSFDSKKYLDLTKSNPKAVANFAEELTKRGIKFWIRSMWMNAHVLKCILRSDCSFVLLTGYTDNEFEFSSAENFVREHPTCEGIELLPYHRLGVEKWHKLGIPYELEGMEPPPLKEVEAVRERFESRGIKVVGC